MLTPGNLIFIFYFKTVVHAVHLAHQQALLRTLQANDTPQLHNEINKAQQSLGESTPLATSVMGMQELIDSSHFQTMNGSN